MEPMKPMVEGKVRTAALALKVELDILDELAVEEAKPKPTPDDSQTAPERVPEASEISR
jgi:hypothetical protein